MAESGVSIGYVARRTGLATSAIRFYEEEGLVAPGRDSGGRRVFARSDIRRLSFVLIAQRLGFTLADVRAALASLPDGRAPTQGDWDRLARDFRRRIDARIAGLEVLRENLDGCIGCGCLSLERCALYNRGDKASSLGAGPRWVAGDRSADVADPA